MAVRRWSRLSLIVVSLLFASLALAQSSGPAPQFALAITQADGGLTSYMPIQGDCSSGSLVMSVPKPAEQPSILKIKCTIEGDAVVVAPSLYLKATADPDAPPFVKGEPKELGTYKLRLGESAVLQGMLQFGLKPYTIKVVSGRPPASERPSLVSKSPSVQMEIVGEDWSFYRIRLRNISSRAIAGAHLALPGEGGMGIGPGPAFLVPGATYDVQVAKERAQKVAPGAKPPATIYLEAVLFSDNTWEGEPDKAAIMLARQLAGPVARARVADALTKIMADSTADDAAKLARIRQVIPALPQDLDPAIVGRMRSEFPNLDPHQWNGVEFAMRNALHSEKESVRSSLKEYENAQSRPERRRPTLADWFRLWTQHASFGWTAPAQ